MNAGDRILPIGAQPVPGGVHFRVWAPGWDRVDVMVYGPSAEAAHPMEAEDDDYFSTTVAGVGAGARYRYRFDGGDAYPDPASRSQPDGVHGPSQVVDPDAHEWNDDDWRGVELDALVIYELHIGAFTSEGTFAAAAARLPYLADLGVTAIEVMPIANFPGARNWGYDGVNLYAPAANFGGPDGFKHLVDEAHRNGLGVILDVVYNHFGPEGNYLPVITNGRIFTDRHKTPWGDAVNYDGPDSGPVRDFVIQNALYWAQEYHVDGLRLDATHAIVDDSDSHGLAEIAAGLQGLDRPRLLIAEDERNEPRVVMPRENGGFGLDAVWADDLHHQVRRMTAGDSEGYFAHYSGEMADVVATLEAGWLRSGSAAPREIPPARFVHCIQNHDQVGNRALGERLNHQIDPAVYRALSALLLLSPYTPLLWMGQEWAATSPFLYFTDHPDELGRLVTQGRREEFGKFSAFADPRQREAIPDPQAAATFERSKLNWAEVDDAPHAGTLALYRELLTLRASEPALVAKGRDSFAVAALSEGALAIRRSPSADGRDLTAVNPPGDILAVINLKGEIRVDFASADVTREPEGARWCHILATEEAKFGGSGGWGRLESEGILHLPEPGAVVLRTDGEVC
jgi:maltooligosyltrehalose trehalohydrolase